MLKRCIIFIPFILFIFANFLFSEENIYNLPEIKVKANLITPSKQEGDTLFTGVKISNFSDESSKNSIYNAISQLPGINLDSDDPFGLGDKRLRIRGSSDYFIGVTVEGIPNYGIMPIGPRDYIYDMENMDNVKIYSGSVPSDLMSGSGNRGGAVELNIKKPLDKANIQINQDLGSFSYSKTFLRLDTGLIKKLKSKFFFSGSYTDADKWKGEGKLGPRKSFTLGYSQGFNRFFNFDIFYNYTSTNRNLFKDLNYYQAKHLHTNFYHDYNNKKTGNPLDDWNYYGNNKFSSINRDAFGIFKFHIKNLSLSLKPYYSKENNSKYEGMNFGKFAIVLNKINDSKRYGLISELSYKIKNLNFVAGNWFEKEDFNPIIKKYLPANKKLIFKGYGWYTKSTSKGKIISPYLKASTKIKKFKAQAGLKYFYYKEPAKKGFWFRNGSLIYDPNISIKKLDYDEFLPSFGIGYEFSKNHEIDFSYSKKYQRPYAYGPLSSFYFQHYQVFRNANITLQDLFDNLDMEKVYAYDLIIRNKFKKLTLTTDFFYQKHKDILVSLVDPRVNLAYFQNDGEAKSLGFEFSGNYKILENLSFYLNASYTKMEFSKNINRGNVIYKVDGKQFPDTPKWLIKAKLDYWWNSFEFLPEVNFSDKRYGDALNKETISSYATVNLNLNYYYKRFKFNIEAKNLFNKKHIGRIYTWDDSTGTTSYYASYPFTLLAKVEVKFW